VENPITLDQRTCPNRKSIERAHCLDAKPNILLVNRLPQKLDFARVVFLIDISVPNPRSLVGGIAFLSLFISPSET